MFSNNISATFQQTKKGESFTYDTLFAKSDTQLILSYNITEVSQVKIHKRDLT